MRGRELGRRGTGKRGGGAGAGPARQDGGGRRGKEGMERGEAPVLLRRGELWRRVWALAPAPQPPSSRASTAAVAVSVTDKVSRRRGKAGKRRRSEARWIRSGSSAAADSCSRRDGSGSTP